MSARGPSSIYNVAHGALHGRARDKTRGQRGRCSISRALLNIALRSTLGVTRVGLYSLGFIALSSLALPLCAQTRAQIRAQTTEPQRLTQHELTPQSAACPELMREPEALAFARSSHARCARREASRPLRRTALTLVSPQWEVRQVSWSLNAQGARGIRLYRPLTNAPDTLPIFDPGESHCRYARSLFEREGSVWALERWSASPPSPERPLNLSLSHPHYSTQSLHLSAAPELSDEHLWRLTPRGVCPSLLPLETLSPNTANRYALQARLACGRGASASLNQGESRLTSTLVWRALARPK